MEQKKIYIFGSSLMHSKKGEERPNHKYKSREWKNGAWVYNYGDKDNGHSTKANNKQTQKQTQVLNQISKIDAIQDELITDIVDDKTHFGGTLSLGEIADGGQIKEDYDNYKKAEKYYENVVKELKNYKYFLNGGNDEWLKRVSGKEYNQKDYVQLMANYTYAKRNLKDSYDKLQKSCEKRFGEIPDHSIQSFTHEYYEYLEKYINGTLDAQNSNMVSVSTEKKKK